MIQNKKDLLKTKILFVLLIKYQSLYLSGCSVHTNPITLLTSATHFPPLKQSILHSVSFEMNAIKITQTK